MRKRLKERLKESMRDFGNFYSSFDTVGDIAITHLPKDADFNNARTVAQAIQSCNKGIKTVLAQITKVDGDFRLRKLVWIAGDNKTRTYHKEHGCIFAVDVEKCYFSPRLSGERLRIARLVQPNETVVNMFAGVGCFSVLIAKHVSSAKIFSIDINPFAFDFMEENIRFNRVYGKVVPILGDAKEIVKTSLQRTADRVLVPLPEKAIEYLPVALAALKPSGGWIHIHAFEHGTRAENSIEQVRGKITQALNNAKVLFKFGVVREVRSIGPNWYQIVADVQILPFPT